MKTLGIIPARGGSKRIPRKNIRPLLEKPLIGWTIECAKNGHLDRVIVSTDDAEIAETARSLGADVPFLRPENMAADTTGIEPVLRHAYEWMRDNQGYTADAIVLLMATNPTRQPIHIIEALDLFQRTNADSVISVMPVLANANPHWTLVHQPNGQVTLFSGDPLTSIKTRSQDLPPCYSRNDIVYILKPSNLYQPIPNLYGDRVELYKMDDFFSADINTEHDWFITEQKVKLLRSGGLPGRSC